MVWTLQKTHRNAIGKFSLCSIENALLIEYLRYAHCKINNFTDEMFNATYLSKSKHLEILGY